MGYYSSRFLYIYFYTFQLNTMIQNSCRFIGRLGEDPTILELGNSKRLCKLTLAVQENYKDKSGNWIDKVTWVNLQTWQEGLINFIQKHLKKGSNIVVDAEYSVRQYEDKDGAKKYAHEFVIDSLTLLDKIKKEKPETPVQESSGHPK